MTLLDVRGVTLSYGPQRVLDDVSLSVEERELFALLGPSGSGKTTLLRVITGLAAAARGEVWFDGRRIDTTPPHQRNFGFMFQEFALFPHLNVAENVAFGLRMQGTDGDVRQTRVEELLALVGMSGYGARKVHELSGGERQRVALARSLAPRPQLLMLDEPLGSLDRSLRESLLLELRGILKQPGLTSIYVTHDQDEAFALADRVLIMDGGRVRQVGQPESIFAAPADATVARFIGLSNMISGRITPTATGIATTLGEFRPATLLPPAGAAVTVVLGDEQARLERIEREPGTSAANHFSATVTQRAFRRRTLVFGLAAGGNAFTVEVEAHLEDQTIAVGDRVWVTIEPRAIRVLLPPEIA